MSLSVNQIAQEFTRNKIGLVGIGILVMLFVMSAVAVIIVPVESFKGWNNPVSWITYPKSALPSWVNYFLLEKIPEHKIISNPSVVTQAVGEISIISHRFDVDYGYDGFPSDFIYEYSAKYQGAPLLQISVIRPDGLEFDLTSTSLPKSKSEVVYHELIFSTDDSLKNNIRKHSDKFSFPLQLLSAEDVVFSKTDSNNILKGHYSFQMNFYSVGSKVSLEQSKLILGGKVYGIIGTDELRRDLVVGLLWGTPLALFIGISVAVGSVRSEERRVGKECRL